MDSEKMMMQRRIDNLCELLETVKRERNALMRDLSYGDKCQACLHRGTTPKEEPCSTCWKVPVGEKDCFVWRGLCKENGGAEDG